MNQIKLTKAIIAHYIILLLYYEQINNYIIKACIYFGFTFRIYYLILCLKAVVAVYASYVMVKSWSKVICLAFDRLEKHDAEVPK